jgi:hypothetical protein
MKHLTKELEKGKRKTSCGGDGCFEIGVQPISGTCNLSSRPFGGDYTISRGGAQSVWE